MNTSEIKTAKAAHVANAHHDVETRARMTGLGPADVEILKRAVQPPLAAFFDGYAFLFGDEDAATVAKVLGMESANPLAVDSRDWNAALEKLFAAGFQVAVTGVSK